jgi:hypothetical protein
MSRAHYIRYLSMNLVKISLIQILALFDHSDIIAVQMVRLYFSVSSRARIILGLLDPDPSIIKQKEQKNLIPIVLAFGLLYEFYL